MALKEEAAVCVCVCGGCSRTLCVLLYNVSKESEPVRTDRREEKQVLLLLNRVLSFEPQFPYYNSVEKTGFKLNAMPTTIEELQGPIAGLSEGGWGGGNVGISRFPYPILPVPDLFLVRSHPLVALLLIKYCAFFLFLSLLATRSHPLLAFPPFLFLSPGVTNPCPLQKKKN